MAADYLSKGLLERASAEISRAMTRGGDRGEGLALLGDVFTRQGLFGEALERYREARGMNGHVPSRALLGETRALLVLGRTAEAAVVAEELLAIDGTSVEALLLAATARADNGDPAGALEHLDKARRLAPARPDVLQKIGDVARAVGDIEGAIVAYRDAIDLDRGFAVVRYELARLVAARGQPKEAEEHLLAALDAVPTYVEATLELASVRRQFGRAKEALAPLVELLKRDPYNLDALLALGETLLALERQDDARTAFDRILRFDPDHAGALYYQGVLLAERHRYRDAIAKWQRVVDVEPASEFARRARRDARTAADLQRIFRSREEVA
jgi:tetratricopeptide (TPR) repeat protein